MEEQTKIALFRMCLGFATFLTSAVFHVNSYVQGAALFLLGVPVELAIRGREEAG